MDSIYATYSALTVWTQLCTFTNGNFLDSIEAQNNLNPHEQGCSTLNSIHWHIMLLCYTHVKFVRYVLCECMNIFIYFLRVNLIIYWPFSGNNTVLVHCIMHCTVMCKKSCQILHKKYNAKIWLDFLDMFLFSIDILF